MYALLLLLVAGDASMEEAVKMFRNKRPEVREEGTVRATEAAEKALAPLIKAMSDKDPEVRRRARKVIRSLLPHEPEPPPRPAKNVWLGNWIAAPPKPAPNPNIVKARDHLRTFGLRGGFRKKVGFKVTEVRKQSWADTLGIKAFDTIKQLNGLPVTSEVELLRALRGKRPWKDVHARVLRDGKIVDLKR